MLDPAARRASAWEQVRRHLHERGAAPDPLFLRYAELSVGQAPAQLVGDLSPDALGAYLEGRFAFFRQRSEAPVQVAAQPAPLPPGGPEAPVAVLEAVVDDRPFLMDSLQAHLLAQGLPIVAMIHPIFAVDRDPQHRLTGIDGRTGPERREVHLQVLLGAMPPDGALPRLAQEVRTVLHEVILAVDDFPAVLDRLAAHSEAFRHRGEPAEVHVRLLEWFRADNLLFLGHLPFRLPAGQAGPEPLRDEGLGLLRPNGIAADQQEALIALAAERLEAHRSEPATLLVEETAVRSRVHRHDPLSAVVLAPAEAGNARTAALIAGLFTNHSLRRPALSVPLIREKLRAVLAEMRLVPGSHVEKALIDFFDGLPKFELFRLPGSTLSYVSDLVLSLIDQPRTQVAVHEDVQPGLVRVLTSISGPGVDPAVLEGVRRRLAAELGLAPQYDYSIGMATFTLYCMLFQAPASPDWPPRQPERLERLVRRELEPLEERLLETWLQAPGAPEPSLARALVAGLPEDYKAAHDDGEILADLQALAALHAGGRPALSLRGTGGGEVKLALYGRRKHSLSEIMPVLTNLRVKVLEEQSYEVRMPGGTAFVQTFLLCPPPGHELSPERHHGPLQELMLRVLAGELEDDPLNALLITCDAGWREINLLMLCRNYLMQVGTVYTRRTINETLIRHPRSTRALLGVFAALFDPGLDAAGREAHEAERGQALFDTLREIDNLAEDRIFKRLHNLVKSTLRTNFYRDPDWPVLAIKLHGPSVDDLPPPRPLYEIFVHGPRVEGVHLRSSPVARGGIRYSDRPDDFRMEVLGLMATQVKKNAIIVPTGAKGGFVVKGLADYGGDVRRAGDAQYREYIRALLSLTDNRVGERVVPPERVARRDGDDPYLVVAADKGTAHLSDTANALSEDAGFWLGDAFASGGSRGYDHKAVGITARGAWKSVQRHFWELGIDVQAEPVRVLGIGDMSGDVFGNGMLCSPALKLVAAFNHREIFLDPDPDPAASYRERLRLFQLPRSQWSDYDPDTLSPGGGVWPRTAKAIPLSAPVRAMLGNEADELSGEALIRALLGMEVDLLWNGGIGTYIKSAAETHADVGDSNNDTVRIDAAACRARVVGEGGNLGITQLARMELDLAGCRLNTDAIDNSGGVDLSDHEVNLKILLRGLLADGQLPDAEARNRLLQELEPEVSEACLADNALQALALSLDQQRHRDDVQPVLRLIDRLAAEGLLDRRAERIPGAQRLLQLQGQQVPAPRPMLAVLLSDLKLLLYRKLLEAPFLGHPLMRRYYEGYFPASLARRYRLQGVPHPLERELVCTVLANRVVNQAGMTFVPELAEFTGRPWWEVAQAYLVADIALEGDTLRGTLYAMERRMPAGLQADALLRLEATLARNAQWLLIHLPPERRGFDLLDRLGDAAGRFRASLPEALAAEMAAGAEGYTQSLRAAGLEPEAAHRASLLPFQSRFMETYHLTTAHPLDVLEAQALERQVDIRLRFATLEELLQRITPADPWQKQLADTLRRGLIRHRQEKLEGIVAERDGAAPEQWVEAWVARREAAWQVYQRTLAALLEQGRPELISLAVVVNQLERL